jgi:hypothetical protein
MNIENHLLNLVRLLVVIFFITACQYSESQTIRPLKLHYQSTQCQTLKPGIQVIENKQQWQQYIGRKPKSFSNQPKEPIFNNQQLVIIAAGQKPNNGYRLRLADLRGTVQQWEMTLPITLRKPSGITNSVITTPCIMVLVDTKGLKKIHAAGMSWEKY